MPYIITPLTLKQITASMKKSDARNDQDNPFGLMAFDLHEKNYKQTFRVKSWYGMRLKDFKELLKKHRENPLTLKERLDAIQKISTVDPVDRYTVKVKINGKQEYVRIKSLIMFGKKKYFRPYLDERWAEKMYVPRPIDSPRRPQSYSTKKSLPKNRNRTSSKRRTTRRRATRH